MRCLDIESQSSIYPSPEVGLGLAQSLPGISSSEEVPMQQLPYLWYKWGGGGGGVQKMVKVLIVHREERP